MPYGLEFKNSNDIVSLDSEFSRLVVLSSGSWAHSGAGTSVSFPRVITTADPPLVFVRPDQSGTLCFCLINGSSGAWTGFSFRGVIGQYSSGTWFCAAFQSAPTASVGLRLWDGNSKILFDNGTPCAQFTRSITTWSYIGSSPVGQGTLRLSWTSGSPLNSGDYMLLNNVAMDIAGGTSRQGNLYAFWDYGNNRLVMQAVGVDLKTTFYTTIVFAKPVF